MHGIPLSSGLNTMLDLLSGLQTKTQNQLLLRDRQLDVARSSSSDFKQTLEQSRSNGGSSAAKSIVPERTSRESGGVPGGVGATERFGRQQGESKVSENAEDQDGAYAGDAVSSLETVMAAATEGQAETMTDDTEGALNGSENVVEQDEDASDLAELLLTPIVMMPAETRTPESLSEPIMVLEMTSVNETLDGEVIADAEPQQPPLLVGEHAEPEDLEQVEPMQLSDVMLPEKMIDESAALHEGIVPLGAVVTEAVADGTSDRAVQQIVSDLGEHREARSSKRMETISQGMHSGEAAVLNEETSETTGAFKISEAQDVGSELEASAEKQSLRAENVPADTTQKNHVVEGQQAWNFNQIMADQIQHVQTAPTVQALGLTRGGLVAEQVNLWLQELDASNLVVREGKITQMEVTLEPRNLGKLVLKLEMENGELRAYFATQSQIVKQTLESQMGSLKDLLQQQGLQVSQLNVQVGDGRQQQNERAHDNAVQKAGSLNNGNGTVLVGANGEAPVVRVGDLWNRFSGSRLNLHV